MFDQDLFLIVFLILLILVEEVKWHRQLQQVYLQLREDRGEINLLLNPQ